MHEYLKAKIFIKKSYTKYKNYNSKNNSSRVKVWDMGMYRAAVLQ